ncbi:MAG: ATP-binding protein [Thermoprotei archaeon]|nr:MAG: ATP-binding protein [Thermoprotei archaeon]
MDPRTSIIAERLKGAARIIAVCSGKGGVGKSLIAALTSLLSSRNGLQVGLLDLDFHGPSCHIILGAKGATPAEDKGLIPPTIAGVKLMSLAFFVGGEPLPLRGADITNAMLELLAITRWGHLDLLVLDSPPGMGEEILDVVRIIGRVEALIVTTPSPLSLSTVSRLVQLLKSLKTPIIGVLENMRREGGSEVAREVKKWGVRYLGWLPYDPGIEAAIGDPVKLLNTWLARRLEEVLRGAGILS